MVSNSIGRDGLVGAEAARRRSSAVGFLLQVCVVCYRKRERVRLDPLALHEVDDVVADGRGGGSAACQVNATHIKY